MKRSWVAALSLASLALSAAIPTVSAQTAQSSPAPSHEATLDQRLARLCEDVDQRREELHISGLSLAIVKDDQVVLARGFGLRDREQKLSAEADTLYGIGSTSKAFTSMLCAMLADEGKLAFDDRPAKFLPWFKFKDAKADREATLRDLMSHQTGLTRTDVAWIGSDASREELLRLIADTEPSRKFREAWQYNNCMFLCAGECAAAVGGASWDDLVAKRIFAPLGMQRSVTTSSAALADPKLSQRYDWDEKKAEFHSVAWMRIDNMAPAGAIGSTVVDMAQWVRFLLNRGVVDGKRLVADARFDELWKEGDFKLAPSYGLGWFLHEKDGQEWRDAEGKTHRVVEHGGNVAGYAAEVGLLPDRKLGLVMLSNVSATQLQATILPLVWNTLLGPWKERKPVVEGKPLPEEATSKWLGPFYETRPTLSRDCALARASGRLVLVFPADAGRLTPTTLTLLWPDASGHWVVREDPESYATFDVDEHGALRAVTMVAPGHDPSRIVPKQPVADGGQVSDLTADDLVAKRVESAGLAAVAKWKSLRLSGTLAFPQSGVKGSYVTTARGVDSYRVDFDAGKFGRSHVVVVGGKACVDSNLGRNERLDADVAAIARFANPLVENGDWRDHAEDVEVGRFTFTCTTPGAGIPLGEACYAVKVKPFGAEAIVYDVSVATQRLVAVEGPTAFATLGGVLPPVALLSDVRDVGGAKIAFHREFPVADAGRVVVQFDRAEVDVEVPADYFELPPVSDASAARRN